ncbi:DsbA family protein [Staphylococcus xylosus]|uniref:DsbA family protein n=1 Tax=Staphylococcus xylosus TaxID=1288 RepID=UPI001642974D|nr:thioredoxin domain-containing protein [Staphylococcus xylosus]
MTHKVKKIYFILAVLIVVLFVSSIIVFTKVGLNDVNEKDIIKSTINSPELGKSSSENVIIEFMDFKCPYCKKFEFTTYNKLESKYISKGKAKFRVVNASILGDDSVRAARAAHALNIYYPNKYWEFHHTLLQIQPDNENEWITSDLIDSQLEKLNIPKDKLELIKKDYKTKGSKSWELANKDKKIYKKYKNKYVPSVYVNGKFIKNPYSIKELEKYMK